MNNWISKNFLNILSSNIALAQVFVVILFFECFSIYVQKQSLLNLSIEFKSIPLKPLLCFLLFVAITKVIWTIWSYAKIFIPFISSNDFEVSSKISYTSFLLLILIITYLGLINTNPQLSPISEKEHFFLYALYYALFMLVVMTSVIITLFASINYDQKD